MSCLTFDGVDDRILFNPISAGLANLPNAAGTIAVLARIGSADGDYIVQLVDNTVANFYHGIDVLLTGDLQDDDGLTGPQANSNIATQVSGAGNYQILSVDWPAGAAALERFHWSGLIGSAPSWTHQNSTGNNGGTRAGPGTTGKFYLSSDAVSSHFWTGEIALVGIWAGVRFTDTDVTNLWVNKRTSDWYNHPAGFPTMLIECTSAAPTDIGTAPSTLSTVSGGIAATGPDPTGWTFDGRSASRLQPLRRFPIGV